MAVGAGLSGSRTSNGPQARSSGSTLRQEPRPTFRSNAARRWINFSEARIKVFFGEVCPVQATLSGLTLEARPLLTSAGFQYLLITAPNAGALSLHVGPCPGEVQVDAF